MLQIVKRIDLWGLDMVSASYDTAAKGLLAWSQNQDLSSLL
jgi:hypothetical protein